MSESTIISVDSSLFRTYLFWSAVLVVKVIFMAFLTARQRRRKQTFSNPEDAKKLGGNVKYDDPDVERVRRAHLNDLENVLPFLILCPLYLATGPSTWLAANLIRAFAASRILHTVCYLNGLSLRSLVFRAGVAITTFMAGATILYACPFA